MVAAFAMSLVFVVNQSVLIALFPSNEAFVYFDDATQLIKVIARAARFAQALEHEPCRLLRDANLLRQLVYILH